jgi:predicted nucleic acid-binding protein
METPTPIIRGLIDTPILIEYREGVPDTAQFVDNIRALGLPDISRLSVFVLVARCQSTWERTALLSFFSASTIRSVKASTINLAERILDGTTPPSALTADDAIVAATAVEHKLPLYTLDPPKFAAVVGLTTIKPY